MVLGYWCLFRGVVSECVKGRSMLEECGKDFWGGKCVFIFIVFWFVVVFGWVRGVMREWVGGGSRWGLLCYLESVCWEGRVVLRV